MKLTTATDPSTIMVEGHPELRIRAVTPGPYPNVYVLFDSRNNPGGTENREVTPDGTAIHVTLRIVERARIHFTVDKPIIATVNRTGEVFKYKHVGTYTPTDGGEPVIHLERLNDLSAAGIILKAYQSTGKVIPSEGQLGSSLTFSNGPVVRTYGDTLRASGEGVNVTETDGKITKIELL